MAEENNKDVIIDENDELITMTYDDGTSENFYNLAELDYKGKWYIYLEPVDPPEDYEEGEVLIYEEAEDENGEEILLPVEDEKLLDELVELLNDEIDAE
ncbi:MAG: DUF1292 domain-containing protein [Christensenellales bacterium]